MAASVAATMALAAPTVVSVRNGCGLSSSSSFGSPIVNVAPLRPAAKRYVVVARAALPAEQSGRAARREILAGLMAAGAALATVGNAVAASGPGTSGAEQTGKKADELLKAADDLTSKESPPRVGPGRVGGSNGGEVAQKAGSGAIEGIQGGANDAIENAKKTADTARENFNKAFNKNGDIAAIGIENPLGNGSTDLESGTQGKVKSDIAGTSEAAKSAKGDTEAFLGKAEGVPSDVKGFVADAQSKFDNATSSSSSSGKGFFDSIKDKVQDAIPN